MGTRRHPERDIHATFDEHGVIAAGGRGRQGRHRVVAARPAADGSRAHRRRTGRPLPRAEDRLARLNQRHGFDCPGCAWLEEDGGRKLAEFCENGAKARPPTPRHEAARSPSCDLQARRDALAGIRSQRMGRKPKAWTSIDRDYEQIRVNMQTLFDDRAPRPAGCRLRTQTPSGPHRQRIVDRESSSG